MQAHFTHNRYTKDIFKKIVNGLEGKGPQIQIPKRAEIKHLREEVLNISQDSLALISGASVGAITSCENGSRSSAEMRVWLKRCMDECVWDEQRGSYRRTVAGQTVEIFPRIKLVNGGWGRHSAKHDPALLEPAGAKDGV